MTAVPLLKHSIGTDAVHRISQALEKTGHPFAADTFRQQCLDGLQPLSLKQRVHHIIAVLHHHLPADFHNAAAVLHAMKAHWPAGDPADGNNAMAAWPVIDYAAVYGLEHPGTALALLRHLTELFSAEFAVQPFILHHFEQTHAHILEWCNDPSHHVRRLASEGMRPQLPWGIRMKQFCQDPAPIWPVLEKLKNDPSAYVRKSVANNLNDISKHHPGQVLARCENWLQNATKETRWIIRHGTRTLVKQGHPDVFPLLGYPAQPAITVTAVTLTPAKVTIGGELTMAITLHNPGKQTQAIVLDYALHYPTASGKQSRKVFKLATPELAAGETRIIRKQLAFKPLSTRRYQPGRHAICVLINGLEKARAEFELV